jgi:fluoride ion exporter CrcB/FEX
MRLLAFGIAVVLTLGAIYGTTTFSTYLVDVWFSLTARQQSMMKIAQPAVLIATLLIAGYRRSRDRKTKSRDNELSAR